MIRANTRACSAPPTSHWIEVAHDIRPAAKLPRTFFSTPAEELNYEFRDLADIPLVIQKCLWRVYYGFHISANQREFTDFKRWTKEQINEWLKKEGFEQEANLFLELEIDGITLYHSKPGDLTFVQNVERRNNLEALIQKTVGVSRTPLSALKGPLPTDHSEIIFETLGEINRFTLLDPANLELGTICLVLKYYLFETDCRFEPSVVDHLKHFANCSENDIINNSVENTFDIVSSSQSDFGRRLLNHYFAFFCHLIACPYSFFYQKPHYLAKAFAPSLFKHSPFNKNEALIARRCFLGALFYQIYKKRTLLDHPYLYTKESLLGEHILAHFPDIVNHSLFDTRTTGSLYFTTYRLLWVSKKMEIPERDEIHIPISSITSFKESKEPKSNAIRVELISKYFVLRRFVFPNIQNASQFSSLLVDSFKRPIFAYLIQFGKTVPKFLSDTYHPVNYSSTPLPSPFLYSKVISSTTLGKLYPSSAIIHRQTVVDNFAQYFPILVLYNNNVGCFMRTNTIYPTMYNKAVFSGSSSTKQIAQSNNSQDPFLNLMNAFAHRSKDANKTESAWSVPCDLKITLSNPFPDATVFELTETPQITKNDGSYERYGFSSPVTIALKFQKLINGLILRDSADDNKGIKSMIERVSYTWCGEVNSVIKAVEKIAEKILSCKRVILYTATTEMNPVQCLLSSLLSVMLCPAFRTIQGLCYLIENEWIQHGCVFYSKYGTGKFYFASPSSSSKNTKKHSDREIYCCLFTLFIDCLCQLISVYPSSFEWSTFTLLFLHESLYNGRFDTFSFDGGDFSEFMNRRNITFHHHLNTKVVKNPLFTNTACHCEPLSFSCTIKGDLIEKLNSFHATPFFANLYCEAFAHEHLQTYKNGLRLKTSDLYPYNNALTNARFVNPLTDDTEADQKNLTQVEENGIGMCNNFPIPLSCSIKSINSTFSENSSIYYEDTSYISTVNQLNPPLSSFHTITSPSSNSFSSSSSSSSSRKPSSNLSNFRTPTKLSQLSAKISETSSESKREMITSIVSKNEPSIVRLNSTNMFFFPPMATPVRVFESITELDISNNFLYRFPTFVFRLPFLQKLDISNNTFHYISPDVIRLLADNLNYLSVLNLANTNVTIIPPGFDKLDLKELDLSGNKIQSIRSLSNSRNLHSLKLQNCGIQRLPKALAALPTLHTLDLSMNKIASIDADIMSVLDYLYCLNISSNPLITPELANLANLSRLKHLYMQNTEMTSFPFQLGTKLTDLVTLDISKNKKLTAISSTIFLLKNLTSISFAETPITKEGIPNTIVLLHNVSISANPNIRQYIESLRVVRSSTSSSESLKRSEVFPKTKDSLKLRQFSNLPKKWRAKVVVVGREKVGKTALVQCITQAKKAKKKTTLLSTNGADITTWKPIRSDDKEKEKDIQVCLWDFAGQQVHASTHQFFLGDCSVVILVWDAASAFETCRVDYWLDEIARLNPKANVFVVATHIDCQSAKSAQITKIVNETIPQMAKQYPELTLKHFQLSCHTMQGFHEFRDALITKVFAFAEEMSVSGILLEREIPLVLESLGNAPPIISFTEWELLAKGCLITSNKILKAETKRLSRLGIIHHYDFPEIRDLVVLNPEYLPKLIATLITENHGWASKGHMKVANLVHIWKGINPSVYPQLLKIFHNFKLVFLLSAKDDSLSDAQISELNFHKKSVIEGLQSMCSASSSDFVKLMYTGDGCEQQKAIVLYSSPKESTNVPFLTSPRFGEIASTKTRIYVNDFTGASKIVPYAYRLCLLYGGQVDEGHFIVVIGQKTPSRPIFSSTIGNTLQNMVTRLKSEMTYFVANRALYRRLIEREEKIEQIKDSDIEIENENENENESIDLESIKSNTSSTINLNVNVSESVSENLSSSKTVKLPIDESNHMVGYVEDAEKLPQNDDDEESDVFSEGEEEELVTQPTNVSLQNIQSPKIRSESSDLLLSSRKKHRTRKRKHITKKENLAFNANDILFIPFMLDEEPPKPLEELWPPLKAEELQFKKVYKFGLCPYGLFSTICVTFAQRYSCPYFWGKGMIFFDTGSPIRSQVFLSSEAEKNIIACTIRFSTSNSNALTIVASLLETIEEQLFQLFTHLFSLHWETFYACNVCLPASDSPLFPVTVLESALRMGTQLMCSKHHDAIVPARTAPDLVVFDITRNYKDRLIPFKQLKVEEAVGVGASATVYRGVWKQPLEDIESDKENRSGLFTNSKIVEEGGKRYRETIVGIKMFKADRVGADSDQIDLSEKLIQCRREIKFLNQFNHPNLLKFYGLTINPLTLVIDLIEGKTTLYDAVGKKCTLQMVQKMSIATEICAAMEYLHGNKPPILHRDLKSPNVLLRPIADKNIKFQAVLCDFGISGEVNTQITGGVENPIWSAPEVISKGLFTTKSDVYAFGVILWELISPQRFFKGYFLNEISEKIVSGDRPEIVTNLKNYRRLVQTCWAGDSLSRPTFREIDQILKTDIAAEIASKSTKPGKK